MALQQRKAEPPFRIVHRAGLAALCLTGRRGGGRKIAHTARQRILRMRGQHVANLLATNESVTISQLRDELRQVVETP